VHSVWKKRAIHTKLFWGVFLNAFSVRISANISVYFCIMFFVRGQ
jgi:hypothetical protein